MSAKLDVGARHTVANERPLILIVDDDVEVRALLAAIFSRRYRVREAGDGNEAVELAMMLHPQLIICDAQMPGLGGKEVILCLRGKAETTSIPVIIISGYPEGEVIDKTVVPAGFLQKPFQIAECLRLVDEVLCHLD